MLRVLFLRRGEAVIDHLRVKNIVLHLDMWVYTSSLASDASYLRVSSHEKSIMTNANGCRAAGIMHHACT